MGPGMRHIVSTSYMSLKDCTMHILKYSCDLQCISNVLLSNLLISSPHVPQQNKASGKLLVAGVALEIVNFIEKTEAKYSGHNYVSQGTIFKCTV